MRSSFFVALRFTLITTVLLGLAYPLAVTAIAQLIMPDKANGQLIVRNGQIVGSQIIGQNFASPQYFHGRPSAAGNGYDAANSGGSNLAQSNRALLDRMEATTKDLQHENPGSPVPVDLIATSASGLDPEISPAAALFQIPRVARVRHLPEGAIRDLVMKHIQGRTFGLLGEPRLNVLRLNLDLDNLATESTHP